MLLEDKIVITVMEKVTGKGLVVGGAGNILFLDLDAG